MEISQKSILRFQNFKKYFSIKAQSYEHLIPCENYNPAGITDGVPDVTDIERQ